MQLAVEIEVQESWPAEFQNETIRNKSLILAYQHERARIDKLGEEDIFIRGNPPKNKYRQDYDALVQRLEYFLKPHRLVGFHCARLTQEEIAVVQESGLRLLSPTLIKRKLDECRAAGYLSEGDHAYLAGSQAIAKNLKNAHGTRTGMIWFCANRSTLQDYFGLYQLFRSWGGEAMYRGHEEDNRIAQVLARIGTPCIVECAIPFDRANTYRERLAERFLAQLVSDEIEYPVPSARYNFSTQEDLAGADVLEIVQYADPRFAALTNCDGWPAGCQINVTA